MPLPRPEWPAERNKRLLRTLDAVTSAVEDAQHDRSTLLVLVRAEAEPLVIDNRPETVQKRGYISRFRLLSPDLDGIG